MTAWPKDTQAARNAFYGDPGKGQIASQMVPVTPPFAMYYEGKRVRSIQFHKKAAPALLAALNEIWDYCQHDQAKVDAAGVSKYAGAYNHRLVRGSKTKWSNHAYAAAIDLNPDKNALGVKKGTMPQFVVDAFCRQGAMWGGWYQGRADWMHFEFVDNGGRRPSSAPPVFGRPARFADIPGDVEETEAPADEFDEDADEPQNIQPQTGGYSLAVEVLQKHLIGLKYFEVGDADGIWGGKTRGAATAFMNDRGRSPDGLMTDAGFATAAAGATVTAEVSKAVAEGWTRPIAPARANASAKDIAASVPAVQQTLWQRLAAKVTGWFSAIGLTFTGASGYFDTIRQKVQPIREFVTDIPPVLWFALLGGAALLLYLSANKATNSIVEDKRSGRLN